MTRTETLADGFRAHVALPERTPAPGMVVLQEIFGVNEYIRGVCRRVADLGYVALAPDMFWRAEAGVELEHTPDDMARAFELVQQIDPEDLVADLGTAIAHVRSLDECDARAGVMGFCFGGTLTFAAACRHDPSVAVAYYGSGIHERLDEADGIDCPLLIHYGETDAFIPLDQVDLVRKRLADSPLVEITVHPGVGHAFDSPTPGFGDDEARDRAWKQTADHIGAAFG